MLQSEQRLVMHRNVSDAVIQSSVCLSHFDQRLFRIAKKCTILSNKKPRVDLKGTETNRSLTVNIHASRYPARFQAPLANSPYSRYINKEGLLELNWYLDISSKPRVTQRYPQGQVLPFTQLQSGAYIEKKLVFLQGCWKAHHLGISETIKYSGSQQQLTEAHHNLAPVTQLLNPCTLSLPGTQASEILESKQDLIQQACICF